MNVHFGYTTSDTSGNQQQIPDYILPYLLTINQSLNTSSIPTFDTIITDEIKSPSTDFKLYVNGKKGIIIDETNNITAIGQNACSKITTGASNTCIGLNSLLETTTGSFNNAIGYASGKNITTGTNNVLVGYNTGATVKTGTNNICIGNSSNCSLNNATYSCAIGDSVVANSNEIVIGQSTNYTSGISLAVKTGIGQAAGTEMLEVTGNTKITGSLTAGSFASVQDSIYEQGSFTLNFTGPTSIAITCYFTKIGKNITLSFDGTVNTGGAGGTYTTNDLPSRLSPLYGSMRVPVIIHLGADLATTGQCIINGTNITIGGVAHINVGDPIPFPSTGYNGWYSVNTSYYSA